MTFKEVCRSCLQKQPKMIEFSPKNEQTAEIIAMLSSVGNIEIEIDSNLPSFLCKTCETKLRNCYAFQLLIQKSNVILKNTKHALSLYSNNDVIPIRESKSSIKSSDGSLCTHCGKKFTNSARFRLHLRIHTGEAPYKCQYCNKCVKNRNYLVSHERTHTGEKPYKCDICHKSFTQKSGLTTHLKIHKGRPIPCDLCPKRFCRSIDLKMHLRRHTGEKPYKCTQCCQTFMQQSHLTEHLIRHKDDRPLTCNLCERTFKQLPTLRAHLKIHTGEKPFKCSQCNFACRQRHSLTQHMKQHSGDLPDLNKPHFCELCQKGYTTLAMLMSHKNLTH